MKSHRKQPTNHVLLFCMEIKIDYEEKWGLKMFSYEML